MNLKFLALSFKLLELCRVAGSLQVTGQVVSPLKADLR